MTASYGSPSCQGLRPSEAVHRGEEDAILDCDRDDHFRVLVIGALCLSIYQGAQQRRQPEEFSARLGWTVSRNFDERLAGVLEQLDPQSRWSPRNVITLEPPPDGFYFFAYQRTATSGRSSPSNGHACFLSGLAAGLREP